jgi:hypothetical protein
MDVRFLRGARPSDDAHLDQTANQTAEATVASVQLAQTPIPREALGETFSARRTHRHYSGVNTRGSEEDRSASEPNGLQRKRHRARSCAD